LEHCATFVLAALVSFRSEITWNMFLKNFFLSELEFEVQNLKNATINQEVIREHTKEAYILSNRVLVLALSYGFCIIVFGSWI
jgi:hypothetical protein